MPRLPIYKAEVYKKAIKEHKNQKIKRIKERNYYEEEI